MLRFSLAVLGFVVPLQLHAQATDPEFIDSRNNLGLVHFVQVLFSDEIDGNCWTNANSVAARTRLLFEQNEVQVIDYQPVFERIMSPRFHVVAIGFRNSSGTCVASVRVTLEARIWSQFGGFESIPQFNVSTNALLYRDLSVFSSGTNLNEMIDDFVTGSVSDLLAQAIAGRRDQSIAEMFRQLPGLLNDPISQDEFDRLMQGASDQ